MKNIFFLFCISILLTGCGGGSGGDSSPAPANTPPAGGTGSGGTTQPEFSQTTNATTCEINKDFSSCSAVTLTSTIAGQSVEINSEAEVYVAENGSTNKVENGSITFSADATELQVYLVHSEAETVTVDFGKFFIDGKGYEVNKSVDVEFTAPAAQNNHAVQITLDVDGGKRESNIPARISEVKSLNLGSGNHAEIPSINFQKISVEIKNSTGKTILEGNAEPFISVDELGQLVFRYEELDDDENYTIVFVGNANSMSMRTPLTTFQIPKTSEGESYLATTNVVLVGNNDSASLAEMRITHQENPDDLERPINFYDWFDIDQCNMYLMSTSSTKYNYGVNCLSPEVSVEKSAFNIYTGAQKLEGDISSTNISDLLAAPVQVGTQHDITFPEGNSNITLDLVVPLETTTFQLWFPEQNTGNMASWGVDIFIVK